MKLSEKAKKIIQIAAGAVLGVAIIASSVFGIMYSNGYFGSDGNGVSASTDTEAAAGGGAVISDNTNGNVKLLATALESTPASAAESSYQLTASVKPSSASVDSYAWSIHWDTEFSGYTESGDCEDITGDTWITDINSADISDYVTLSSTSGSSVTVSCYQAFGNPLIIECVITSYDGSTVSATVDVNYQCRVTGINYVSLREYSYSASSLTYVWSAYITGLSSTVLTIPEYSSEQYDENSYSLTAAADLETTTGTIAADYTGKMVITSNSKNAEADVSLNFVNYNSYIGWVDFLFDLFGYSAYTDTGRTDLYTDLSAFYNADEAAAAVSVSVTDNLTSEVYTCSCDLKIDPVNFGTSATSVTVSPSTVTF